MTINQSSTLTENFANDRHDEESDCSDWENEKDIDFKTLTLVIVTYLIRII